MRQWLSGEHLIDSHGCQDSARVYIWADSSQRTLETGRAFAESLLPGCGLGIHSKPQDQADPLFAGFGTTDPQLSLKAVQDRLTLAAPKLLADLRPALAQASRPYSPAIKPRQGISLYLCLICT